MQGSAWTLTGNTTFATSGTVQAGVLTVGGDLTSPLFSILSGGTLTGTGKIIATGGVSNGGTIRVDAGETLTITGALTQSGTSTFAVGITPASAGLLSVSGAANLGGSALSVLAGAGTFAPHTSYTILTAASVSGTFSGFTSSSPFLTPSVVYNPASVVLTLDRSLASFASAGNTPNEIASGAALDTLPTTDPLVTPLVVLSAADAARAFDQLSGEAYASAQAALADDSRYPREAALDRVDAAFAAIDALKAGHRSIWGQGFGGMNSIAGDGNAAPLGSGTGGLLFGMDGALDDMPVSVLGGFSASRFSIADRGSEVATQSFHFGATAGREMGGFRLKGGIIGSLAGITVDREVRYPGFSDSDTASYAETTGQLFAELSYAIAAGKTTLEPFGRLVLVGVSGSDYAEAGGDAALSGHSDGYGLALATLGLTASTDLALADDFTVHARGRLGLQQGFGGAPTATNRLAGSDSFTIAGTSAGGTTLLLEADLSANLTPVTTLSLGYSAAVGTNGGSGALKATLSGAF
jgi:outer membrane autotransporter protein